MRKRFPDYGAREIVTDWGLFPAFQDKALRGRFGKTYQLGGRASANQNRIAARYLRTLERIANVLGPNRSVPNEIVDRFYEVLETRKQGT